MKSLLPFPPIVTRVVRGFHLERCALLFAGLLGVGSPMAATAPNNQGERTRELIESAARYEHAEGKQRDFAQAHALYCEAARMGSADALLRMGWMYANGRGVPRSDATAHALFKRAAGMGNDVATRLADVIRARDGASPASTPACLDPRKARAAQLQASHSGGFNLAEAERFRQSLAAPSRQKIVANVYEQARRYGVDPMLVLAVMAAESNFDPNARSPKNAQGLMQLIPETAERFAVTNILDPVDNVRGGIRYLRWLLAHYRGNVELTLAGYNAGEGAVNRHKGVPPYPETMAYVARIRSRYPHGFHPFDPKLAGTSPLVAESDIDRAAMKLSQAPVRPTTRVTYFLDGSSPPKAHSIR